MTRLVLQASAEPEISQLVAKDNTNRIKIEDLNATTS